MNTELESAPLTDDDLWIWARLAPLFARALAGDRRDALIMSVAQRPGNCPCCGARCATLETSTGGWVTPIDIRPHRRPRVLH